MIIDMLFPRTHLQTYLSTCSQLQFESKLTPRPQKHERMFYPFYYKDPFVRDCIFELKERDSHEVARLFGKILGQWIVRKIHEAENDTVFYLVPVPQHISKTKEKGFCHTTTLATFIEKAIKRSYPDIALRVFPCISKVKKTKRLHDTKGKRKRFNMIKNTMWTCITKHDAEHAYFSIIDDVFTTGATYKEMRRSLSGCAASVERMFFVSIAH